MGQLGDTVSHNLTGGKLLACKRSAKLWLLFNHLLLLQIDLQRARRTSSLCRRVNSRGALNCGCYAGPFKLN